MVTASYAWRLVLAAAAFVLCAGLLNAFIDPYGLIAGPRYEGVNATKIFAHTHTRLAKERRAARIQPQTVLIGNSRVDVGFNPASAAWPVEYGPASNLGVPGEGIEGALASLWFLKTETQADTVLLGLDFTDFLPRLQPPEPIAGQGTFAASLPKTMFSLQALTDSLLTVARQGSPDSPAMNGDGFNPMRDHLAIVRREGHFALADQKNRQNLARLTARPSPTIHSDSRPSQAFQQLDLFFAEAKRHNLRVVAFIYPFHAAFLQSITLSGHGEAYAAWKGAVTQTFHKHAGQKNQKETKEWALWDFGVYAQPTMEPIPDRYDKTSHMQWWWEPGHYKAELGDRILRQMLAGQADFGVRLTAQNLTAHLARQKALARQYQMQHAPIIRHLLSLCPPKACRLPPDEWHALRR